MQVSCIEEIKKQKVIAVIRSENGDEALEFAEGCIEGGLRLIEVTFSFPEAERVISELSGLSGITVGAGTVLDVSMAEKALLAGARFLVSPHTDKELITYAKQKSVPTIQGALTSSEIVNAWKSGVDMVKVFPVKSVGGASYIKAIKEPLPFVDIMTTGGVNFDNFTDFLKAGASAVGLASALLGEEGIIDRRVVSERAKRVLDKLYKDM
jgi:2-dehydro-3-deoxyphosphogluconate aldolase / (4S)-4-hydroxy-2-oxoglutarate aldolase